MGVMDTLLEGLYVDPPQDDNQRVVQDALSRYFALHEMDRAKDAVLHRVLRSFPGSDANLERQNLELDVELKRKRLGLLDDTEEFNAAENGHLRGGLAALGIRAVNAMAEPPKRAAATGIMRWFRP